MKNAEDLLGCLKKAKWDRMTTKVGGGIFEYNEFDEAISILESAQANTDKIAALETETARLQEAFQELHRKIWGKDIPFPATPEYREWHENCQAFMKFIRETLFPEQPKPAESEKT